jgi:hypothetical protein
LAEGAGFDADGSNQVLKLAALLSCGGQTIMMRACTSASVAAIIGLAAVTQSIGQNLCRPTLTFNNVQFSPIAALTHERKWTATVTANTSDCAVDSGGFFDIVFRRLSENAPDLEFRQRFAWSPFSVNVAIDFAADEAVGQFRIENVTPCVCRDRAAEDRAAANSGWRKQ